MIMEENDTLTPSSLHFPREDAFFAEPITTESSLYTEKFNKKNNFITLAEMEKNYIQEVLRKAGGNKILAAKLLGIGRSTLFRKLEQIDKK